MVLLLSCGTACLDSRMRTASSNPMRNTKGCEACDQSGVVRVAHGLHVHVCTVTCWNTCSCRGTFTCRGDFTKQAALLW